MMEGRNFRNSTIKRVSLVVPGYYHALGCSAFDQKGERYQATAYQTSSMSAGTIGAYVGILGTVGSSGDGGLATNARLNAPTAVATDVTGNLIFTDNLKVKRVDLNTRIITTIAGNGQKTYAGDGGAATSASFFSPEAVVVDNWGNIYISDSEGGRIRYIAKDTGIISTFAGDGTNDYNGDNIDATLAKLSFPRGLALDSSNLRLFVADAMNHRIRSIALIGAGGSGNQMKNLIQTVAGTGTPGTGGDFGPATLAQLNQPAGVAVDGSQNIYIVDTENHCIRMIPISTVGLIVTIVGKCGVASSSVSGGGGGGYSYTTTIPTSARLSSPFAIALDQTTAGRVNLLISDTVNGLIRLVNAISRGGGSDQSDQTGKNDHDKSTSTISIVAGTIGVKGDTGDGLLATASTLTSPRAICLDSSGNLFIADTNRIRRIVYPYNPTQQDISAAPSVTPSSTIPTALPSGTLSTSEDVNALGRGIGGLIVVVFMLLTLRCFWYSCRSRFRRPRRDVIAVEHEMIVEGAYPRPGAHPQYPQYGPYYPHHYQHHHGAWQEGRVVYAHVEIVPTPSIHSEGAALPHNHPLYSHGQEHGYYGGYADDCPDELGHTVGQYVPVDLPLAVAVAVPAASHYAYPAHQHVPGAVHHPTSHDQAVNDDRLSSAAVSVPASIPVAASASISIPVPVPIPAVGSRNQ